MAAILVPKLHKFVRSSKTVPSGHLVKHTLDEYASYVTNLFQIRPKMAEWWPFRFPEFDKLGPKVKKLCQIRPNMAEWWPFRFPEFDKFGPKVKKTVPLGRSQPGTRHRPFGAIFGLVSTIILPFD